MKIAPIIILFLLTIPFAFAEESCGLTNLGNCLVDNSSSAANPGVTYPGYAYLLTRPVNTITGTFYTGIKFLNQSNTDNLGNPVCEEFFLDGTVLKELKTDSPYAAVGDENAVPLSSLRIDISSIKFGIDGLNGNASAGQPVGDQDASLVSFQPRVTILMQVKIGGDPLTTIQTTVSQRNLNAQ